jgi:hypothetical protein
LRSGLLRELDPQRAVARARSSSITS